MSAKHNEQANQPAYQRFTNVTVLAREPRVNMNNSRSSCVYTVKNIRRFNGKIIGNQLPAHSPVFLQAPVKIFRNHAQYGSKDHFVSYSPTTLQRYFRVLSVSITLPHLDF